MGKKAKIQYSLTNSGNGWIEHELIGFSPPVKMNWKFATVADVSSLAVA